MDRNKDGAARPGLSEGARRATEDDPGLVRKGSQRFSARRKVEIVLRLLRGEDPELLCRELGVTAARAVEGKRKAQRYENPGILEKVPAEKMTFTELADWCLNLPSVKAKKMIPRQSDYSHLGPGPCR